MATASTRLVLICGLPASGKSRSLGAGVELHHLDAPLAELIARAERRNASGDWTAAPMTGAHMEQWATTVEPPDAEELGLFDEPLPI